MTVEEKQNTFLLYLHKTAKNLYQKLYSSINKFSKHFKHFNTFILLDYIFYTLHLDYISPIMSALCTDILKLQAFAYTNFRKDK